MPHGYAATCNCPPGAEGKVPGTSAFRPPGRTDLALNNFCVILGFCITYRSREASIIQAQPPAAGAAVGITTAAASCAKQSQTWADRGTWGNGASGRPIVQNEPNLPAVGIPTIPLLHYSSIPIRCRLCETKPNLGRMGYLGDGAWGANRAKRSQFRGVRLGPEGEMCKTNPIPGGAGWDEAAGARDAGEMCRTKPISEGVSGVTRRVLSESCETNPICPRPKDGPASEGASVVSPGDKRAKRSQFVWARYGEQLPDRKGVMTNMTREWARQNEANFGRSFKCKVSSVKSGKPGGQPSGGLLLQTLHFALSAERRLPQADRAKQSQFSADRPLAAPLGSAAGAGAATNAPNKPNSSWSNLSPAIDSGEMPSSDVLSCGSYMAQATGGPL
jgi:hypothetical protein